MKTTEPQAPATEGQLLLEQLLKKHLTLEEIAEAWQVDVETLRRRFKDEPGVLAIPSEGTKRGKRKYTTLRIPADVASRVYRRMLNQ